ncbi:MAG TPA: hypothetical protein VFE15_03870 [Marmoricola sp.]|nr:hypothetical protein [Marmoricola sp.]
MSHGRTTRALLTGLVLGWVLILSSACLTPSDCGHKTGASTIRIRIPSAIAHLTRSLDLRLCQGTRCASTSVATKPATPGGALASGVTQNGEEYAVDVGLLGKNWEASSPSTLTILGVAKGGRTVLGHTDHFEFTGFYPNGKDCDAHPNVTFSTTVSGADLLG